MPDDLLVDPEALRSQVRDKYREVAVDPHAAFHFHTGPERHAAIGSTEPTALIIRVRACL